MEGKITAKPYPAGFHTWLWSISRDIRTIIMLMVIQRRHLQFCYYLWQYGAPLLDHQWDVAHSITLRIWNTPNKALWKQAREYVENYLQKGGETFMIYTNLGPLCYIAPLEERIVARIKSNDVYSGLTERYCFMGFGGPPHDEHDELPKSHAPTVPEEWMNRIAAAISDKIRTVNDWEWEQDWGSDEEHRFDEID